MLAHLQNPARKYQAECARTRQVDQSRSVLRPVTTQSIPRAEVLSAHTELRTARLGSDRPLCIQSAVFDKLGIDRRQVISRVVRDRLHSQLTIAEQYYLGLLEHITAIRDLYEKNLAKKLRARN